MRIHRLVPTFMAALFVGIVLAAPPACTPQDRMVVKTVVHAIDELLAQCVEENQGASLEVIKQVCRPGTPEDVAAVERLYQARLRGYARMAADAGR